MGPRGWMQRDMCAQTRSDLFDVVINYSLLKRWRTKKGWTPHSCCRHRPPGLCEMSSRIPAAVARWRSLVTADWLQTQQKALQSQSTGTFPLIPTSLAATLPGWDCRLACTFLDKFILFQRRLLWASQPVSLLCVDTATGYKFWGWRFLHNLHFGLHWIKFLEMLAQFFNLQFCFMCSFCCCCATFLSWHL